VKQIHIPEGYNTVMPYLIVKDGLALIQFLKDVFGATEKLVHKHDDGRLMHGEVIINNDSCIMVAEAGDQWGVQNAGMYINVADADATYKLALEKGASSIMPPADQSYGRSGGITDPQGNTWWITSELKS
jgi:PhnB protein